MHPYSKDISCHSTQLISKHALSIGMSEEKLFEGIQEFKSRLLNPQEWINAEIVIKLFDNYLRESGGDIDELAKLGFNVSTNQFTFFQLFFFKIAPFKIVAKKIKQLTEESISKCFSMEIELKGRNCVEFIVTPASRDKYSIHICQYNKGCGLAALHARKYSNIQVKEIACAALSDSPCCRYEFTWDLKPKLIEKVSSWLFFRLNSQEQILSHMEEAHRKLQSQYNQIKTLQEFYSHIMMNMGEGVVWCNSGGIVEFTNSGFLKFVGIDESAVLNRLFLDLVNLQKNNLNEILEECKYNPLKSVKIEIENKKNGAEKKIGEASVAFIESESRSNGFLIVVRDITEAKEIEKMLYLAENRYRSLYENSPALIIGLDTDGNTIYANPAMVEQSGYSEKELKKMHISELIAPDSKEEVQQLFSETMNGPNELREIHYKTKDNQWKSIALSTYQLHNQDGKLAGLAGIGVDITETKRLNEQIVKAQRMELLGQLAGGLAHDFSNIISLISGYSKLITMKTTDDKSKEMGSKILTASNRAYELIHKLVLFSKGNTEVEYSRICLNDVAREVQGLVVGYATGSIKVTFDIPEEEYIIYGNSGSIHQCILNLCINARDALREGNVQSGFITVRLFKCSEELVRIEVEDNATGIPPQSIEKIFDPFFTTKKDSGGTGLGLSVVYGIVKSHKGTINVNSRPGDGTTFIIELPLIESAESECKKSAGIGTVVIIDDDPAIRGFCMEILRHYKYKTIEFPDECTALEWIEDHKESIGFILTDINMPGMVPQLFIDQVQAINSSLKILWMSGNSVPKDLKEIITEEYFLRKPFTPYMFMKYVKMLNEESAHNLCKE